MVPSRLEQLRHHFQELDLDAVLISNDTNRRYLSGFTGSAGYLLISHGAAILATDFRYVEQSRLQAPDFEITRITGDFSTWVPQLISEIKPKRIGFESDDLTVAAHQRLVKAARKVAPASRPKFITTTDLVETLRATKDAQETDAIRAAAKLADAAVEYASTVLQPSMTEKELAWSLEKFLREEGSEELPFEIIIASGPNAARPHAQPSDRQIHHGEPVVIDLGGRVNGYTSDITRTICIGEPDETFRKIYRIVAQAQHAAINHLQNGSRASEIDRAARDAIAKEGYGEAFGHGLGHGVGLQTHEAPSLSSKSEDILSTNMVFTIEPGIYLEGWGGVRIEDMVLLGSNGPSIITKAKKLDF